MPYDIDVRGWMPEDHLDVIEKWAKDLPENSVIVEVGSFLGRSAVAWALSALNSQVFCFDRWEGEVTTEEHLQPFLWRHGLPIAGDCNSIETFIANTAKYGNILPRKIGNVSEIEWSEAVDIVFIDAAHCNPMDWDYIQYWLPFIKRGGYISGHDYGYSYYPDVTENVHRLEELLGVKAEVENTLWRIKKP